MAGPNSTQPISARGVLTPVSRPEEIGVVARPVDAPAITANNSEALALAKGLQGFSTGLDNYLNQQAESDILAGKQARAAGQEAPPDATEWFKRSYMAMDGRVKGLADAAQVQAQYETGGFDKDAGNLEQFLTKHWNTNTAGLTDKYFTAGYQHSMGAMFDTIRKAHSEYQRDAVIQTVDTNANKYLDGMVSPYLQSGKEVPADVVDHVKGLLKDSFGTTGNEFNKLLFNTIKKYGEQGNFAAYDLLKRPNPDGTPGMYFIPAWKPKIDEAIVSAQNTFLSNRTKMHEIDKQDRLDRIDHATYDVISTAYSGDEAGAKIKLDSLIKSGLIDRSSDLFNIQEMLRKVDTREARADQMVTQTELQALVMKGKAGLNEILAADLQPKQKQALMTEWNGLRTAARAQATADRMVAVQAQQIQNLPYNNHKYTEQEDFLKSQFPAVQTLDAKFAPLNEFRRAQSASAQLELAEWVRTNPKLEGIRQVASEIAKRHQEIVSKSDAMQLDISAKNLRYLTPGAAAAAAAAGYMSDADLADHMIYFRAHTSKPPSTAPHAK